MTDITIGDCTVTQPFPIEIFDKLVNLTHLSFASTDFSAVGGVPVNVFQAKALGDSLVQLDLTSTNLIIGENTYIFHKLRNLSRPKLSDEKPFVINRKSGFTLCQVEQG